MPFRSSVRTVTTCVVLSAVFLTYIWRISDVPMYLHDAEVLFGLHIRSIAANLHDANGRFLPLYFQMTPIGTDTWFHPMLVYVSAPFLKILPLSEWSLRLPTVCVGVLDVVLAYLVADRMFQSRVYGLLAAALLTLTPAHFIHSRFAMDYIYPVPFVLGWLWLLQRFEEDDNRRFVFLAGLTLGAGFFSYIGAVILTPLYFAMTLAYVVAKRRAVDGTAGLAVLGFCLPLLLLAIWIPAHPQMINETISRYGVRPAGLLHSIRDLLTRDRIGDGLTMYWNLNSPVYLFLVGSSNWVDSTRHAGVFLIPMALFMAAGVADFIIGPRSRMQWVIVGGILTAPLGTVFVGEPWAIQRELELLPFAALLATFGIRRMARAVQPNWRAVAAIALVLTPIQFIDFYRDYFGDYRLNSLGWFGSNLRGAVTEVLRQTEHRAPSAVYVSTAIPYALETWQLYLAKARRDDLWPRTRKFDANTDVSSMPTGSVVVEPIIEGRLIDPSASAPELTKRAIVKIPEGGTAFVILERQ